MSVLRIVANLAVPDPRAASAFYERLFGLSVRMDHGWIVSLGNAASAPVQLALASEGGAGTPVPALSIEVDDVDAVHAAARAAGDEIVYPLTDEPWGVRRFHLRDPTGVIVNVLSHRG